MQSTKYFGAILALFFGAFQVFGIGFVAAETFPEEGILDCAPNYQIVEIGETASFSVSQLVNPGDRFYIWHAPEGNPDGDEGTNLDEFETSYSQAGDYTVTVFSAYFGNDASNCYVKVVDPNNPEQVDICHATDSHITPYVAESPAVPAILHGHDPHQGHDGVIWFEGIDDEWGDIIPPFLHQDGSYPGKNWTTEGQAIWNNDCKIPDDGGEGETPSVTLEKVAENLGTNEFGTKVKYTITWEVENGNVSDLVITDVLPDWTDGIVSSITPSSNPVLTTGQLNYIDPIMNPTNNRTIRWDFDGQIEGATGTVSFIVETWNNEICSVANTATITWMYGNNQTGTASDTSNTINIPDDHCDTPTPTPTVTLTKSVENLGVNDFEETKLRYTINWSVSGGNVDDLVITDVLGAENFVLDTELFPTTPDATNTNPLTWDFDGEVVGASGTITFTVEVNNNLVCSTQNKATAAFTYGGNNGNAESNTVTTPITDDHCQTPTTATLHATKIVCDSETDLPNWSGNAVDITSSTDEDFLATHPNCHKEPWSFQWAQNGVATPNDNTGTLGSPWANFSESTTVPAGTLVWVREVWNDNYVPFSSDTDSSNGWSDVSAELYCHTDVLNYDNFDFIDPVVAGQNYYCIGFNAPVDDGEEAPQCSDNVDNNDPEDTLVDENDPGCHTDGDATDGDDTYNPNDTSETNESGGGGGDDNECEDNIDNNDPEDTLVDENDPGCHTDGDATDGDDTYNPDDDNETDENNNGGGGGGDTDECEDNVDNNDPEDTLADEDDPGCHTDGDATDGDDTYNPNDDDETDGGGTGGGDTQCTDGVDNDDPEDTLIDQADPGCHTDNDATDGDDTYEPNDDNETDEDDNGGGGGGGGGGGRSSSGSRRSGSSNNPGQVLGAENSCGIHVDKYLRVGHANDPETVMKVQNFLNFYLGKNLAVDGVYGATTEAAVREFQVMHSDNVLDPWGISESTGIFYLTTQTEVNNILCPELNLPIPDDLINWSQNPYVVLPPPVIA